MSELDDINARTTSRKIRAQAAEIEALRQRVNELESQVSNQRAVIEGKHQYVGQDFQFRIKHLTEQLAACEKERDHWREMNSLHLYQLRGRVEELLASQHYAQRLWDALNECLTNIASGRFDQDMVQAALSGE